jgi:hypothetical protein
MPPLRLTDTQLGMIMQAAKPLQPTDRDKFLQALAAELQGQPEPGDGQLYQLIRRLQRAHWDPPLSDHEPHRKGGGRPREERRKLREAAASIG